MHHFCGVLLVAALLTGCQTWRDYGTIWNIDHVNGLNHRFKVVVEHGVVYEQAR